MWVGSSGPAPSVLLAVKRCADVVSVHASVWVRRLSAFGFSVFGRWSFFPSFCRLLFFGFLWLLFPLSSFSFILSLQTFMPFLIFFLGVALLKSVLAGKVHVCEVPSSLMRCCLRGCSHKGSGWWSPVWLLFCTSVSFATIFIRCFSSNAKGWSLCRKGKCLFEVGNGKIKPLPSSVLREWVFDSRSRTIFFVSAIRLWWKVVSHACPFPAMSLIGDGGGFLRLSPRSRVRVPGLSSTFTQVFILPSFMRSSSPPFGIFVSALKCLHRLFVLFRLGTLLFLRYASGAFGNSLAIRCSVPDFMPFCPISSAISLRLP